MAIHDFAERLAFSHAHADAPWWLEVYRKAFPGLQAAISVRDDGWAQRGGIDRVITLASGRTVTVDEKVREEDWPDILLERFSDQRRKTPGWIQKTLACDYIAYAFVPSRTCYLLPFLTLRRAWMQHGPQWIEKALNRQDGYRIVEAKNSTYVTESIAVPISDLMAALTNAMTVTWTEQE